MSNKDSISGINTVILLFPMCIMVSIRIMIVLSEKTTDNFHITEESDMRKIYKSSTDKKICGVCGGIAEYFDIDVTIVRIVMAALVLTADVGLILYIIAAIVMKEEPECIVES